VPVTELRSNLASFLDEARSGRIIEITRSGRPAGRLVPPAVFDEGETDPSGESFITYEIVHPILWRANHSHRPESARIGDFRTPLRALERSVDLQPLRGAATAKTGVAATVSRRRRPHGHLLVSGDQRNTGFDRVRSDREGDACQGCRSRRRSG
jgi:prevent-host-death family protein